MLNKIDCMELSSNRVNSPENCEPLPMFAPKNSLNNSTGDCPTIRAEMIQAPRSIAAAPIKIFHFLSTKKNIQNANAVCGLTIAMLNITAVKHGRRSRVRQQSNSRQQIAPPALPVTVEMIKLAGHANNIIDHKFLSDAT